MRSILIKQFLSSLFILSLYQAMFSNFSWKILKIVLHFFSNFWRTSVHFLGPLIPLFWTSGDICPRFQNRGGFPHLYPQLPTHNIFLRFTSGATPAELLASSMAAEPFHARTFLQALVGLESMIKDISCTKLYALGTHVPVLLGKGKVLHFGLEKGIYIFIYLFYVFFPAFIWNCSQCSPHDLSQKATFEKFPSFSLFWCMRKFIVRQACQK